MLRRSSRCAVVPPSLLTQSGGLTCISRCFLCLYPQAGLEYALLHAGAPAAHPSSVRRDFCQRRSCLLSRAAELVYRRRCPPLTLFSAPSSNRSASAESVLDAKHLPVVPVPFNLVFGWVRWTGLWGKIQRWWSPKAEAPAQKKRKVSPEMYEEMEKWWAKYKKVRGAFVPRLILRESGIC